MGQMIGRCVATEGNKRVIHKGHITNGKKGSEVKIQSLQEVAGKCKILKNNSLDKKLRPFHPETILKRALLMKGDDSYNIFTNNCEHFATWCRYGIPVSEQVITCIRYCKYGAFGIILLILYYLCP